MPRASRRHLGHRHRELQVSSAARRRDAAGHRHLTAQGRPVLAGPPRMSPALPGPRPCTTSRGTRRPVPARRASRCSRPRRRPRRRPHRPRPPRRRARTLRSAARREVLEEPRANIAAPVRPVRSRAAGSGARTAASQRTGQDVVGRRVEGVRGNSGARPEPVGQQAGDVGDGDEAHSASAARPRPRPLTGHHPAPDRHPEVCSSALASSSTG